MKRFTWDAEPEEKLEALCGFLPPILQGRWKERFIRCAERIVAYDGGTVVTADIFWDAVYEVLPGGYEPLILRFKDPERLKADMLSSRSQEDMQPGTEPVRMVRWAETTNRPLFLSPGKKIVAVNSSARKGGNTDIIIDELLHVCGDNGAIVEKYYLCDLNIKPCTGCRVCRKVDVQTICSIKDDMTELLYGKLYGMDGFIMGFPIYTARENGIMSNFMDRWDCFANPHLTRRMPSGKKGLVVSSWMWPNMTAYDNVVEQMVILLKLHGITVTDVLTVSGTRGKKHGRGVVKNNPNILKMAHDAGMQFLKNL